MKSMPTKVDAKVFEELVLFALPILMRAMEGIVAVVHVEAKLKQSFSRKILHRYFLQVLASRTETGGVFDIAGSKDAKSAS